MNLAYDQFPWQNVEWDHLVGKYHDIYSQKGLKDRLKDNFNVDYDNLFIIILLLF